jgi:hypothetical protein
MDAAANTAHYNGPAATADACKKWQNRKCRLATETCFLAQGWLNTAKSKESTGTESSWGLAFAAGIYRLPHMTKHKTPVPLTASIQWSRKYAKFY